MSRKKQVLLKHRNISRSHTMLKVVFFEHRSNQPRTSWAIEEIKTIQKMASAAQEKESKVILYMEIEIQLLVKLNPMIAVKQIKSASKTCSIFFLEHGRRKSKDLEANLRPD